MQQNARIFVAGHRGLVGSAILRRLEAGGFRGVLTATREQFLENQHVARLGTPAAV